MPTVENMLAAHGNSWQHVATVSNIWQQLETNGNMRQQLATCGNSWHHVATVGNMGQLLSFFQPNWSGNPGNLAFSKHMSVFFDPTGLATLATLIFTNKLRNK